MYITIKSKPRKNPPPRTLAAAAASSLILGACLLAARLQAQSEPFTLQKNLMVPMRDGARLAANLFRPAGDGPFPVILMRTPYGKPGDGWGEARRYCPAGYAMVVQDCRGRGDSEGTWDPFRFDPEDGFDTQEWIGSQPWCNGRIGTAGGSYVGWTQWASAPLGSRYLRAMVPIVPFSDLYRDIAYPGGAFQLSLLFGWGAGVGGVRLDGAHLDRVWEFLPLNRWDEQFDKRVLYLRDWVAHPAFDDYWRERSVRGRYDLVQVPVLNIGGWWDIFSRVTLEDIRRVRETSANRLARRNQFVIIGPWGHGPGGQRMGELDYGPAAKLDIGDLQFRWFEYWLREQETGIEDWPPARLFVMGENVWRDEQEWPLARTRYESWHFHSGGKANTRGGDGGLAPGAPSDEPPDRFTYDPKKPVPTRGGNNLVGPPSGPFDQSAIEDREDVLVFSSAPLERAVEVTGPVKVILYAASTAPDTDFTAKLVDVHPDGRAFNLVDGIIRARCRESFEKPTLIEPDRPYRYEIDLWVTSNLFQAGHRLRVEISSSNFPRFDRNPNTGAPFGTDAELRPATQTVYHDAEHPSHILLPVIPR